MIMANVVQYAAGSLQYIILMLELSDPGCAEDRKNPAKWRDHKNKGILLSGFFEDASENFQHAN